jgi:hypothetical protein
VLFVSYAFKIVVIFAKRRLCDSVSRANEREKKSLAVMKSELEASKKNSAQKQDLLLNFKVRKLFNQT